MDIVSARVVWDRRLCKGHGLNKTKAWIRVATSSTRVTVLAFKCSGYFHGFLRCALVAKDNRVPIRGPRIAVEFLGVWIQKNGFVRGSTSAHEPLKNQHSGASSASSIPAQP